MEVDIVNGEDDIVLKICLSSIYGGQRRSWIPTRIKRVLATPISWLAEVANGEDSVSILSDLACTQQHY